MSRNSTMTTTNCCAECGNEGGVRLKTCKSCMSVKYCNAECQKNHWATHKKECKQRAAEIRDEALFKDPTDKNECPICFLQMPLLLISCATLPPATIETVPIFDSVMVNENLANMVTEQYFSCCGKSICRGCVLSINSSESRGKCPFCNSMRNYDTVNDMIVEVMRRVDADDPASIYYLADSYHGGLNGIQRDVVRATELYNRAASLGYKKAHCNIADIYRDEGDMKKAKFHYETAAMAGNEAARFCVGCMEERSGNMERAVKHWIIAASAGCYDAMYNLLCAFKHAWVSRDAIDSSLTAYNNSCAEMRSEARDDAIHLYN